MVLDTNDAVNKVAAYAAGSRPHRKLSEQQLTEAWLAAFKKLADDLPDMRRERSKMILPRSLWSAVESRHMSW